MISDAAHLSELRHDCAFRELKRLVIETTGLSYYSDKDEDLCGRIQRRLRALGECTWGAYLQLLQDPETKRIEWDRLAEELTVGETSFFRHPELFRGLRENVLPDILHRNRDIRRLRVWSAGCSTGAEAYSVAILLAREYAAALRGWEVSILGTDINKKSLAQAREGSFAAWDFRGAEHEHIEDCFTPRGTRLVIHSDFQRHVRFAYHNLATDSPPLALYGVDTFDLILCRNVLIYFSPETNRRLVRQFYECIVPGGWLLVGHAEPNVELFRSFQAVNVPGAVLYQKPASPVLDTDVPKSGSAERSIDRRIKQLAAPVFESRKTGDRRRSLKPEAPGRLKEAAALPSNVSKQSALAVRLPTERSLSTSLLECENQTASRPMDAAVHLRLAMLHNQVGDHACAEASIRRVIYLEPSNALAHYLMGVSEQRQGRKGSACHAYGLALTILADRSDFELIPNADDLAVGDLRNLIHFHQEALSNS
ncbi:MAG: CheR family methyltransferase [Phycisphaerales bacterium]